MVSQKSSKLPKIEDCGPIGENLKDLYKQKLLPLEKYYYFDQLHSPPLVDGDFSGVPIIMFVGQYSTGKTTFIKYLLGQDYPGSRIGPEPTTDQFIAITYGEATRIIPGNIAVADQTKQFGSLAKFGNNFLNRFSCSEINNELVKRITIIDTPGILASDKMSLSRGYPFLEVICELAQRCDRIYLLFDAHKLDISDEFSSTMLALKNYDSKIRIILNKADSVNSQSLIRVYGALMWSIGKIFQTPEVIRVYIGSFWDEPLREPDSYKLFQLEEADLMDDLARLPPSSIIRRLNDLIKRTICARTNGLIISEIHKIMPSVFFKDSKKVEILNSLPEFFSKIKVSCSINYGDFPDVNTFHKKLKLLNFAEFPPYKKKIFEHADSFLKHDLPLLLEQISSDKSNLKENAFLTGGIFTTLSIGKEVIGPINPFDTTAAKLKVFGVGSEEWVVERIRSKYEEKFDFLANGVEKIKGEVIRNYLQETKLQSVMLMKIWNLSDIDNDGCLDMDEFLLCMYLIELSLEGTELPTKLPETLIPPSKIELLKKLR